MKRKKILTAILLTAVFLIGGIIIAEYKRPSVTAQSGVIAWGSRGGKVTEIQQKLKQWGYYQGAVDGVFGQKTYEAVVKFQKKHGLSPDGVVGTQTANALGVRLTSAPASGQPAPGRGGTGNQDVYLLARAVHGEARGEPYIGKVAVAAVILNRVKDSRFPNTIAGVIYQPGAFTAVSDGQINLTPDDESLRAARDALNGWDPTYGAIYYYNPAVATSKWIFSRPVHITIGKHVFAT